MSNTFDPKTLTEADVDSLTGRELAITVDWWVRGDDLRAELGRGRTGDHRHWSAVRLWWDQHRPTPIAGQIRAVAHGVATYQEIAWLERDGQPWQSDLESHVAKWRAEPMPLTTEGALELLEPGGLLEWREDFVPAVVMKPGQAIVYDLSTPDVSLDAFGLGHDVEYATLATGPDITTAIYRAAVKVAMRRVQA